MKKTVHFLGTLVAAARFALPVAAADQPQWGAALSRNMVSAEISLPDTFDLATRRNVKFVLDLGSESYATPIVAGGHIYIGTNNERPRDPRHQGDRGVLMCFAEKDGKFLWQLVVPKYSDDIYTDWPKSGLCSPATVEGDRVYILSNRGEALCLAADGMTGGNRGPFTNEGRFISPKDKDPLAPGPLDADILWAFDIHGTVHSYPHDAAHASFLLYGDYLYINTCNGVDNTHKRIRQPDAPSLIVLDKRTGRLVAQDGEHLGPRIFHNTHSSPSLGVVNGQPQICFAGGDGVLYGFEPVTNPPPGEVLTLKRLWKFDGDPESPKEEVHRYNSNRKVSPSGISGMPVFLGSRVYYTIGGDIWWGKNEAWLKCVNVTGTGDLTKTGEVWSYPVAQHCIATPAVFDGMVFVTDCGRKIHCVEAQTGKPYWTHDTKGDIWASPLVADGKVYVGTRAGEFLILAARREKQVLATVDLGQPISGTATAANGVLYVATMRKLYALEKQKP
jgi:outer membrane protein assembly factor BamB